MTTTAEHPDVLRQSVGVVLALAKIPGQPALTALTGGANNRVYRVDIPTGSLVLKEYFQDDDDGRGRLDAEFRFLKMAWLLGVRAMPRPIARLPLRGLGLYEFINGRAPRPADVTARRVDQAAEFVAALNRKRTLVAGAAGRDEDPDDKRPWVGLASDACLSLAEHLASVERRLARLTEIQARTKTDADAAKLVHDALAPAWKRAADELRTAARDAGMPLADALSEGQRFLSPSDFGFHNAVITPAPADPADPNPGEGLRFIDLEYAGWDDAAKLVCDFFTQVALPVPEEWFESFLEKVTACLEDPEPCRLRARLLLPVYRIKWCCLVLNEFLPAGAARRRFALTGENWEEHKARQVEKARELAEGIKV